MKYQCIAYPTEKRHYINPSLLGSCFEIFFFLANLRSSRSNFANLQLFRERNCSPNETKCNQLFVNPLAATTETPRDLLESESLLAIQDVL